MLVDAQHLWAARRMPFAKLALESTLKVALHGGRADTFAPAQPAAIDSVQVLSEDHSLKGFAGPLAGLNPWKPLAEVAPAAPALKLAGLQLQNAVPQTPVLMPHAPYISALVAQLAAPAVRTQSQPSMPRQDPDPTTADLKLGNLIIGQS